MIFPEKVAHAQDLIRGTLEEFEEVRIACSWGKDSMVVLHLAREIDPNVKVFTILTHKKPKETFQFKEDVERIWNLQAEIFMSEVTTTAEFTRDHPDQCCQILKVEPTRLALEGVDCWITGLRNTEGPTRGDYKEREEGNTVKLNPILTWTEREVWLYTALHTIPVHPWYALGYRSLGCAPCTSIVSEDASERDGRWKGTSKEGGECGIHTKGL